MRRIHIWLITAMLMVGTSSSAMAQQIWQEEIRITSLDARVEFDDPSFRYSTSDPSIATVSQDGVVRFHKEGTGVIYLTRGDITLCYPFRADKAVTDTSRFRREVLRLVNEERVKRALAPLREDAEYQAAADIRAEEITRYFSHTRPDGRPASSALTDSGMAYPYMGENIAMGQTTPAEVMASWMTSDGHRANILRSEYTHLAVGLAEREDGALHWVQLFTKR